MKRQVSVVVTDLDNTLYDWVDIWYSGFSAMIDKLVSKSGLPRPQLEVEIQTIFQKYGTSEYAFVIEEIPSLISKHPGEDLASVYEEAIIAYREARKSSLRLYPCVRGTLEKLKRFGCLIVAYTESMEFYTTMRLKKLALDGVLDYVYFQPGHGTPPGFKRNHEDEYYELQSTVPRHTPAGELKPNPDILISILNGDGIRAAHEHSIYIGDSLMKDVKMAQEANITDVLAEYGVAAHTEAYDLLRRVTHWTDEDVEREKKILVSGKVRPTFVLKQSFEELLDLFDFVPHPTINTV